MVSLYNLACAFKSYSSSPQASPSNITLQPQTQSTLLRLCPHGKTSKTRCIPCTRLFFHSGFALIVRPVVLHTRFLLLSCMSSALMARSTLLRAHVLLRHPSRGQCFLSMAEKRMPTKRSPLVYANWSTDKKIRRSAPLGEKIMYT